MSEPIKLPLPVGHMQDDESRPRPTPLDTAQRYPPDPVNAFTHQLCDFLRLIGLRDRLRCPECKAVGTYKPHGGWLDDGDYPVRRWMCKWCGYYRGPEGDVRVAPDPEVGVWRERSLVGPDARTPQQALKRDYMVAKCWPWRG